MHTINRSTLVAYDTDEMYRLVNNIEEYPEFLPWCDAAQVLEASETHKKATLGLALAGFRKRFTTLNHMQPGERIEIRLVDGPFRELTGTWRFQQLGEQGSKVSVDMRFQFSSRLLEMAVGATFKQMVGNLVEAFHRRAKVVYGER